jgi:hypothetical protein
VADGQFRDGRFDVEILGEKGLRFVRDIPIISNARKRSSIAARFGGIGSRLRMAIR